MTPPPVTHIGVLVADLDASRRRWATVLGSAFSPVTRYRCPAWRDLAGPEPHLHDARLSFWLADRPSIEMLEFVGEGTHSSARGEGGHHIAFPPIPDNDVRRAELERLGVAVDGDNLQGGRSILMFGDARATNNVYTEWVEDGHDHPDVKDDGSPVNRLPDGSKTLFDVETILELRGHRPDSRMTEIGIDVADLAEAVDSWTRVTGYPFGPPEIAPEAPGGTDATGPGDAARSAISTAGPTAIRLVETTRPGAREGLAYAVIRVESLDETSARLEARAIPVAATIHDRDGRPARIDVDPSFTNGFSLRFAR